MLTKTHTDEELGTVEATVKFGVEVQKDNIWTLKGSILILTHCRATNEWQLVAVHRTRNDGYANKANRAVAIVRDENIINWLNESLVPTRVNTWSVSNFNIANSDIKLRISNHDNGLAENVLERAKALR